MITYIQPLSGITFEQYDLPSVEFKALQHSINLHSDGELTILLPQIRELSEAIESVTLTTTTHNIEIAPPQEVDLNWVNILLSSGDISISYKVNPSLTHTVTHSFGRIPMVQVFTLDGRRIYPSITATDTYVTIESSTPITCIIVLR